VGDSKHLTLLVESGQGEVASNVEESVGGQQGSNESPHGNGVTVVVQQVLPCGGATRLWTSAERFCHKYRVSAQLVVLLKTTYRPPFEGGVEHISGICEEEGWVVRGGQ
jgi:hypothetical protein